MKKALVAGASGLIGGYVVKRLLDDGFAVRAIGRGEPAGWRQLHKDAENISLDLSLRENCVQTIKGVDQVYDLAAHIGGVNFIEQKKAETMLSVLINTHLLLAAKDKGVERYFYSSTGAVAAAEVPQAGKALTDVIEDGHIWEKLFSEKLCKYFREDFGVQTRIGRFQNVYGPHEAYDNGRERATAALCRKGILAKHSGNYDLEIWGDGNQKRAFVYVEDVADAVRRLTESDIISPVRIGSPELITINQLVDAVEKAAGIKFNRKYKLDAPKGTERAVPPLTEAEKEFNFTPCVSLEEGIKKLYDWMEEDMRQKGKI